MGSRLAEALGLIVEFYILVCVKNHISGSINNNIVRVSGQVVKEVVDGLIGAFSG